MSNTIMQAEHASPLGPMLLAATEQGLAGVWFVGQKHMPDRRQWRAQAAHPVLDAARQQLDDYFSGRLQAFALPLDIVQGTDFQRRVWQALQTIPYGTTTSYGTLAKGMGAPQAVRAVGMAIGRNPLSIIIPCHRVLGANGSLTGYAGGLDRKHALLQLEHSLE